MRNKRIISVFIILVFLAAAAIGGSAVFTVAEVLTTYTVISGSNSVDVSTIEGKLNGFEGRNIIFLKEDEVLKLLSPYTYVKVDGVKKVYPNYLEVSISERKEVLAAKSEGGEYYMLDKDGFVVGVKDINQNNVDGNKNIELTADCVYAVGSYAAAEDGNLFNTVLSFVAALDARAKSENANGSVRNAVSAIAVKNNINIEITMCEGLIIRITDAGVRADEKLLSALNAYYALTPEQRSAFNAKLITVILAGTGEITTAYSTNSK